MTLGRNSFIDVMPGGLGEYVWQMNHEDEDEGGTEIGVDVTAPVGGVGFVRQIGEASPMALRWRGTILERSQHQKMWDYFNICAGRNGPRRTIHLVDFSGARYEGLLTRFNPVRKRAAKNPRGATANEKLYYWTYDLQFDVTKVVAGWP
jgi:hypothetical protein